MARSLLHTLSPIRKCAGTKRFWIWGQAPAWWPSLRQLSGAASAIACDLDKHALDACLVNGNANQVELNTLEDLELCTDKVDLLIAADVLYDRENIPWLERLGHYANEVLIADSRIRDESVFKGFEKVGDVSATTIPDLDELKEFGDVTIYYRKYR